ncbi:hypothetical protein WA026_023780 [Henosepilachna vigintioctopunctata]|uniref:RNA-directed DNA polymerase n=1 Tax=Henosepilachna vigintioctopunctata TaxID=420089 RepID=A0AAW1UX10_9CUCU
MFKKRASWKLYGRGFQSAKQFETFCQQKPRIEARQKVTSKPDWFSQDEWNKWLNQIKNFMSTAIIELSPPKKTSLNNEFSVQHLLSKCTGDNRPYLNVNIYDETVSALLDSGSNISILGSSFLYILKALNLSIDYDVSVALTTADGKKQSTLGYVFLPITLNEVVKSVRVLIVPSIPHKLILGVDFLELFNIKVDFSRFVYDTSLLSTASIHMIQDIANLSSFQREELNEIIDLFKTIGPEDRIGRTHLYTHTIITQGCPIRQRQYPLSPSMQTILNKEIDKMLELDIIKPVTTCSPWLSPLWLVDKKDGTHRVCFDGRKLNSVTMPDSYPMPLIDTIVSKIKSASFLSSIDLKSAFFQIPLDEESKMKTAFSVQGRGLFCFNVLPFGLHNSAQAMCKLMDVVIGPSLEPYVFYYVDDIIVATPDFDTHVATLRRLFERLKEANLTINFDKCKFCRPSLKFLGFIVDQDGLRTDPDKVESILNYPTPTNTTQIRRLIGLVGYYRRFLKNFSTLCSPISDLLKGRKKGQSIVWTKEADDAFREIKLALTTTPILASPDFSKRFFLACDASNVGVGGVLFQESDGVEHPVAYFSKTLNKCQRKYTTTEKELLAIILSIERFRPYIEGTRFTVITDHSSLIWLGTMKNPSPRIARWILKLSSHAFDIVHRSGVLMNVPDSLSRIPEALETAVLDLSTLKPDRWYRNMLSKVSENKHLYPDFKVVGNVLYKHVLCRSKFLDQGTEWKIVVPTSNRSEILQKYHDEPTAGHLGVSKTLARISLLYYWPKMRESVLFYVRNCKICASCKSDNLPAAGRIGNYRNINFPFQLISADLLGPYPRSKNGNQYLLVVTDWFTKFVLVHPLYRATSKAICKFIENQVFLIFGVPQIFVVDNGVQFTSNDFKNLIKSYNVQKIWYNAKYFPQINPTERVNRTITTAIRSFIQDNHKHWDQNIHQIAQAIRLAKHEVTSFSPSFLCFLRNVPTDGGFFGHISENSDNIVSIKNKVLDPSVQEKLPELYEYVQKRIHHAYKVNAQRYNLRRRDLRFRVGDRVWKRNFVLSDAANNFSAKLAPKFVPCVVKKVLSPVVYNLEDLDGNDLGIFHISHIKLDITHEDIDSHESGEEVSTN